MRISRNYYAGSSVTSLHKFRVVAGLPIYKFLLMVSNNIHPKATPL